LAVSVLNIPVSKNYLKNTQTISGELSSTITGSLSFHQRLLNFSQNKKSKRCGNTKRFSLRRQKYF